MRVLYGRWPVIAYYPVNRVVEESLPTTPDSDSFYGLDVYKNALGGKANYQSFFEWFRNQDDILNQRFSSRSKWMERNQDWIKQRVRKLFVRLEELSGYNENDSGKEEFRSQIKRFEEKTMSYGVPVFFFQELSHLAEVLGLQSMTYFSNINIFRDLKYMLNEMGAFRNDFERVFIDSSGLYEKIIERFIRNDKHVKLKTERDEKVVAFFWDAFSFALLLNHWWLSDKAKHNLENELGEWATHFRGSLTSFPNYNNEDPSVIAGRLSDSLMQIIKREVKQNKSVARNEGHELQIVRDAIEQFVSGYKHLRVDRAPRPRMLIDKNGKTFDLDQLSDGLEYSKPAETYGMSLDRVVELVMDDESRPDEVRERLDLLFELIERNKFAEAKQMVCLLKADMPTDPEVMRAEMLIRQEEMTR